MTVKVHRLYMLGILVCILHQFVNFQNMFNIIYIPFNVHLDQILNIEETAGAIANIEWAIEQTSHPKSLRIVYNRCLYFILMITLCYDGPMT